MAKSIAFIDNFDEVEIFFKSFNSCFDKNTVWIACDALAFAALKDKGIHCRSLDDYRIRKEYEVAENYAVELAGAWFFDYEGNDFTEFKGISLGECLKRDVFLYYNYLLNAILDVLNILKIEKPEKVFLVRDCSISNALFGKNNLYLHKKIFLFLMNDKKYDVIINKSKLNKWSCKLKSFCKQLRLEKQNLLGGKISYYCPVILNSLIKKLVVMIVDQVKEITSKNKTNFSSVRAITLAASDITYFGNDLIESFLRKGNCYLYYFEGENNCYFDTRILSVSSKRSFSLNKEKSEYMTNLKIRFEKTMNYEKTPPRWIFKQIPLFNFTERYLKEIIKIKMPKLVNFYLHVEDVIKRNNFNIVLISERWGAKRIILTQLAKRSRLPVLHISHSIEVGVKSYRTDIKYFPFYPTLEISGLKCEKQKQIKKGIDANKVLLTGIPRFGNFNHKTPGSCYDARKRLGFLPDEEIVLFVIEAKFRPVYDKILFKKARSSFELSYIYKSFMKLFLKRKNSKAVFKLKMYDINGFFINDFKAKNNANNIIIFRNHLQDLLIASDAVVVIHSNVGIEAIYRDTPVIILNDPNFPSQLPLCMEKAAIEIESPDELIPVLDRLRDDKNFREQALKNQRNFLQKNLPDDNLSAAERVTDVIYQLAEKKSAGKNNVLLHKKLKQEKSL